MPITDQLLARPAINRTTWLRGLPFYGQAFDLPGMIAAAEQAFRSSRAFFDPGVALRFELQGNVLSFPSPYQSPHLANNTALALWYPAARPTCSAVIVIPHWTAEPGAYRGLCRLLNRAGISCLEAITPYHGPRAPHGCRDASFAISANLLRTIATARQATLEIRCCADWLEAAGFHSLGLIGTSLGSSYTVLAAAHDNRFGVNVLNHCSGHLPEVVWDSPMTLPIRRVLERTMTLDDLRVVWKAIDPTSHLFRLSLRPTKTLLIYGWFDRAFPRRYSQRTIRTWRELGMDSKAVALPCGHRTLGMPPFKYLDGYHIYTFMKENLNG